VIVKDESKSWLPLRLDHLGRQVDEQGRVVQMDRPTELKVNLKAREEAAAPQKHMPHAKIATTIIKEEGMSKFHGQWNHAEIRRRVHANAESGAMLIVLTLTVSLVRSSVLIRASQILACPRPSRPSASRAVWCWFVPASTSSRLPPCA